MPGRYPGSSIGSSYCRKTVRRNRRDQQNNADTTVTVKMSGRALLVYRSDKMYNFVRE